ncbi:hypothetical protein EON76_02390 [bacterium]|nr:MAG: hypothetical protein EON76_02390 [bacterium]
MLSIYNKDEPTKVINSRAHKKLPIVWRRRQGVGTQKTFTTYERPALAENKKVVLMNGDTSIFNLGKLLLSISFAFAHDRHAAQFDSHALAQTVEDKLSMDTGELTPARIAHTTYQTLNNFDELAAIQYAARHKLISTTKNSRHSSTK